MYNYNVPNPQVYEVDKTLRSFKQFRTINGENYITLSASDGRKLMQRVSVAQPFSVQRVLARGQDSEIEEAPEILLVETKDHARKRKLSVFGRGYIYRQLQTSKLELNSLNFYQALLAEFIGVFILTLVVCGIGIAMQGNENTPSINGALGGGLTLATMVWCMNCISGGNLNPAISIALLLTNDLVLLRGVFFIVSQLLGAYTGIASLNFLIPEKLRPGLGVTSLNENVSLGRGFAIEFLITFVLALTVYASIDKNRKDLNGSIPLAIGLSVTCGALFGGPYTGGSMNPARSFGPALFHNMWANHWIYWVGPVSGAICAGFVYKIFGYRSKKQKPQDYDEPQDEDEKKRDINEEVFE